MDHGDRCRCHRWVAGAVFAALLATASPASAQAFESIGTRALGMAGAFVAVADDATATYWNPAGLSTGAFLSLLVDHTANQTSPETSQLGAAWTSEAGTMVAMSTNAVGFSYYRLRTHQLQTLPPLEGSPGAADTGSTTMIRSVVTHNLALTGAQFLYPGVSLGSTLRYVRGVHGAGVGSPGLAPDAWLQESGALESQGQNKVDLDLGLKFGGPTVQVGIVARNLLQPTLDSPDGSRIRLDRQVRAGIAVRPVGGLLVAADIDVSRLSTAHGYRRSVAIGAEQWFGLWLALRGGARLNLEDSQADLRPVGAFGVSLALTTSVFVDAQLTRGPDAVERGWSVSGRVGF